MERYASFGDVMEQPSVDPVVTIVIPARNAQQTIGDQLSALETQVTDVPFEVVVVNDCSTDDTVGVVRSYGDKLPGGVRILKGPGTGPAAARNVGMRAARGNHILCCDADDVVCAEWVEVMSNGLLQTDVVGGRIDDVALNPENLRRALDNVFDERLQTPVPGYLPYAPSGNVGIRREVFDAIGGFDENLRTAEDIDFSWHAQEAGFTISYIHDSVLHRRYRDSLVDVARQFFHYAVGFSEVYSQRVKANRISPQNPRFQRKQLLLRLKQAGRVDLLLRHETRWRYVRIVSWSAGGLVGYLRFRILL